MNLLGGFFLYHGNLTVGVLMLFYNYTQKLIDPINNLPDFYRGTQIAVGAAERIHEYLFTTDEETEEEINFKNGEVNLLIEINRFRVFIKGESGSGKTNLLKLSCGFHNITDGIIKICNEDVHKIKEKEFILVLIP